MTKRSFIIIISLILILSPAIINAQRSNPQELTDPTKFRFSVKYGFSISGEKTEPPVLRRIRISGLEAVTGGNFQLTHGPKFGATLDYKLRDYLMVELDFDYLYQPMTPESQEMRAQLYNYIVFEFDSEGAMMGTSLSILYDLANFLIKNSNNYILLLFSYSSNN